ncbi:hypothetical protein ABL78_3398 [Leptomonas seymouri]|uniref:Uncharacterized protein n=1 Tax=Leptomonas seymouri TaxID=5684 RepID=A0A0N1PER5_LEPSE|nr:hypothetical protein ABL78_3398 [Leptomonas seymouri]|eukprot:KPI87520.1 hypothetical protein ABL78_3398 [Leptomonas seymouri]
MKGVASPLLSYAEWRAEAAYISELAQHIPKDKSLESLLSVVASRASVSGTAAAQPLASHSFFAQLFSSSADATTQPVLPWCASLAQLLALAELPAPGSIQAPSAVGSMASAANSGASSAVFPAHRSFAQVVAAVANSSSGSLSGHADRGDASVEGHSLVSSSHAILPMRVSLSASSSSCPAAVASSASKGASALHNASFDAPQSHRSNLETSGVAAPAATRAPRYDDRDAEGDEGFDRIFARLKQQAAERSFPSSQSRSAGPTAHLPPPPQGLGFKSEAASSRPPPSYTGLIAARVALDAATHLLLRVRQQNDFSTVPSGRVAEAQTLILRATACREAQLYTERILEAVHALLQQHYQAQVNEKIGGEVPRGQAFGGGSTHVSDPHPWADGVMAASPEQLHCTLRCDPSYAPSSTLPPFSPFSKALQLHRSAPDRPSNDSIHLSADASPLQASVSFASYPPTQPASAQGNRGATTAAWAPEQPPASASSMSFYLATHSLPGAAHTPSGAPPSGPHCHPGQQQQQHLYLLPGGVVAALHQWGELVAAQQRALRCEEVHDYIAAAQLFLNAAAERAQLGCCQVEEDVEVKDGATENRNLSGALARTPVADLASHGVTHLLRVCGLLLADPFLEREVVYPASLLKEVEEMLTAAEAKGNVADSAAVRPPPLLATPHASRVWMLLAQLASFLEHHRLPLPWDTAEPSSVTASMPPLAHATASASTLQMLWEVSAAVLLFRPVDALRVMQHAVSHTHHYSKEVASCEAGKSPVCVSLHELFLGYTCKPATAAAPSPQQLLAQPGTLPLCLFSLRRASAAAVRARHYAEALRNVEIAVYLLHSPACSPEAGVVDGDADEAVRHRGIVDYGKVGYWRVAAAAAAPLHESTYKPVDPWRGSKTTVMRTSTCLPALINFSARLHFFLMRILLVLLASPLTAGEAAAEVLREGALTGSSHTSSPHGALAESQDAAETTTHRHPSTGISPLTARLFKHLDAASRARQLERSLSAASDVSPGAERGERGATCSAAPCPDKAVGVCAAVADLAATLRSALHALQDMTDQLRLVEQEGLMLHDGPVAHINPYLPTAAYRLSTVLSRAAAAQHDSSAQAADLASSHSGASLGQEDDGAGAMLSGSDRAPPIATPRVRRVCVVTSSARYQQLKQKYQAEKRSSSPRLNDASLREQSPPSSPLEPKAAAGMEGARLADAAVLETRSSEPHDSSREEGEAEDDVSSSPTEPSSEYMFELQQLVHELLAIVYVLTLPLSSTSACAGAPGGVPPVRQDNAQRDVPATDESGYDMEYGQARMMLNTLAGRLQRCLRQLGARDRVLFTLLRRLHVELLFPVVCGPML